MAAKSKKRLYKIENKLDKLEKLELKDVYCSICQSILVEPVTLPCFHNFCKHCFNGSIENNALCCPLCRLRIGSWLRKATKQKTLLNVELWSFIQAKFPIEIEKKINGEDDSLPPVSEIPKPRLSEPGEIRREYEAEVLRLRTERLRLEQLQETEMLIQKIQKEENEAHKKFLEALKKDEILAIKIQKDQNLAYSSVPKKLSPRRTVLTKTRFKPVKIDDYLVKAETSRVSFSTEDDSSTSSSNVPLATMVTRHLSPEIVPTYSKLNKTFMEKRDKSIWNKENGTKTVLKKEETKPHQTSSDISKATRNAINSLVVSLPLPNTGILQHKSNVANKSLETESVDSVRQELCYFKPIDGTTTTFSSLKGLPLKVPGIRADIISSPINQETAPSRDQYLEGLTKLRNVSLAQNLPSAFVLALSMLRVKKGTVTRSKYKKMAASAGSSHLNNKKVSTNKSKQKCQVDAISKFDSSTPLKRTRSTGSLRKEDNELTPKKAKVFERKVQSERKPHLRSDTKKTNLRNHSPQTLSECINNNKVNLAVKNLSSPLKNCEVKILLQEQLQIEKIIEQEKNDFKLARKIEAEWNGRRQPRRGTIKRQVTINYALRPAKKVKA